jgi:hypothetical protein
MLRLLDAFTGAPLATRLERAEQEQERAEQERHRAEQERERADQAEEHARTLAAEVERLKSLLTQARGESSGGSAEPR